MDNINGFYRITKDSIFRRCGEINQNILAKLGWQILSIPTANHGLVPRLHKIHRHGNIDSDENCMLIPFHSDDPIKDTDDPNCKMTRDMIFYNGKFHDPVTGILFKKAPDSYMRFGLVNTFGNAQYSSPFYWVPAITWDNLEEVVQSAVMLRMLEEGRTDNNG